MKVNDASSTSTARIPIISLAGAHGSGTERHELGGELVGRELVSACHDIGFAILVDHGLPDGFLDRVFETMAAFFALPHEQKLLIDKRRSPHFRGWEAVGTEFTNNRPDVREQIDLWSDLPSHAPDVEPHYLRLLGPNQRLPEDVLPGFGKLTDEWFERLGALADHVVGLIAAGLGLHDGDLADSFGADSMSLTKLISYPPTPPGGAGVNAHHDTGFVTLLAAGSTPGLQVLDPLGDWIDVPVVPNSFVLNIGEMLQAMTGNYLVATAHRVITAEQRLSAAYFHGPSLDTRLDPLPLDRHFADAVAASARHRAAGFMATKEQTETGVGDMASTSRADTYGQQLWNYFARSYPEMMHAHHGETVRMGSGPFRTSAKGA